MNPPVGTRHTGESPICKICRSGEQEPFCIGCERLQGHDAAIRETVLDGVARAFLKALTPENCDPEKCDIPELDASEIADVIKSLRAATPGNRTEPDRQCNACIEGLVKPCEKPLPGCPYDEPEKKDGE